MAFASKDPVSAELTPAQIAAIAAQVPPTDISGKVDKVTGSALLATTEAAKIHASGSDNQDLSGLQIMTAKGAANGYAPLDSSSKVPTTNLPDTILGSVNYHGTFSAAGGIDPTVSPLALQGDYFVISVAGTINAIVYLIGDWIIYSGTTWERVDNSDKVSSVNGQQGVVVLSIPEAQVQTDWNSGSGMGQLLNKPTIPNVRLFANLANPVASSGTTEKVLLQLQIPAARAVSGSTFRAWIVGNSSSTGTLIFRIKSGVNGTISDTEDWKSVTSAAQAANARAGFECLITVRSATTIAVDGVGYAGAIQLPTTIAAPATPAIAISGVWYINMTVVCSSGTFTAQVGSVEEIR